MKASELQIGDLIYVYGQNGNLSTKPHWYIRKVTADWLVDMVRGEEEDRRIAEKGITIPAGQLFIGDTKSIPLTKDILKANGFKMLYTRTVLLVEYDGYVILTKNQGDSVYNFASYGHYKIPIMYVHELQRILRCCGLLELADNFKI